MLMQSAGTPHYMAPEMIKGNYDTKADIFSVGIILCQMLTGWHPFYVQGDDAQAAIAKIGADEPIRYPEEVWTPVSDNAKSLVESLLAKRPEQRLSAKDALAHPWLNDPGKASPFGGADVLSKSIFEGLLQYSSYNKLKKAVLQILARELTETEIQELRTKFHALDTERDGLLSPQELLDGMKQIGYDMTETDLNSVIAALDTSGSKRIGYKDFISALIHRRVKFDRQQLWECFKKIDKDQDGSITYEDMKRIMKAPVTESEWQEITGATSTGEQLNFEGFCQVMAYVEAT